MITRTPSQVSIRPNEEYNLIVPRDVTNDELAGLSVFRGTSVNLCLDLFGCRQLTGAALAHLADLRGLTSLDLRRCDGIAETALSFLRARLPNTTIIR
jgi:hypothetical protein